MEGRDILKVKDQLKDLTKMFETCWLLGCPTTRKPGLKDNGLPKARNTELCIQASKQALMGGRGVMFGTAQRIGLGGSPLAEDMYYSLETEEVLEHLLKQE